VAAAVSALPRWPAEADQVIDLWQRCKEEGSCTETVRMLEDQARPVAPHFVDMRARYGVVLGIVLPGDERVVDADEPAAAEPATPRFCTLVEDEGGNVLDCDRAFTEMLGYTAEEMLGHSVLDHIHPDDQGRAVEGWLARLATRRDELIRRAEQAMYRSKDGANGKPVMAGAAA
jgi:hypothetical protein